MCPWPDGPHIDVSVTIHPGMPVYPGDPGVEIELARSLDRGDPANVSRLELGAHTGTHVDAPRHFIGSGPGAHELALDPLVGPRVVADLTPPPRLAAAALPPAAPTGAAAAAGLDLPRGTARVLLKSRNSRLWARSEFAPEFAR